MSNEIIKLTEDVSNSPLYSDDLAPVPEEKRSWGMWDLAALWVGMAVCIPTYLLASYMIKNGLSWLEALIIIALGNVIITLPMVMNGHAGVKYGIPFPVVGRAAFGTKGIHIASVVRGIVACGWFGIQTWIGGLAFYAIWNAMTGAEGSTELVFGKFVGFALFWLVNLFFILKGTESIKWLEKFAAPILISIGILLIAWGAKTAGGFGIVLQQSDQLAIQTAILTERDGTLNLELNPIKDKEGKIKATDFKMILPTLQGEVETKWISTNTDLKNIPVRSFAPGVQDKDVIAGNKQIKLQLRDTNSNATSTEMTIGINNPDEGGSKIMTYLLWLTAMVGFWATMAISIADITRFTSTQRNQRLGQFIGLPGTMALFSFVGIFVTCASVINFQDVLIAEDAPWDPVSLLAKFDNPIVVIIAQIFMLIATLSTNIAANVIAPANAFSNLLPKQISFVRGGVITAIFGIIICPWWMLDEISSLLLFVSSFLGPVLGILICDYFIVRKKQLDLADLFKVDGIYSFGSSGINSSAMIALLVGVLVALLGLLVPALSFLYTLSWFTGFFAAFIVYYFLMPKDLA